MCPKPLSLADRLYSADPGLLRLNTAIRITLTTAVTVGVLFPITAALGQPTSHVLVGMLVAAVATMSLNMEPRPNHRAVTMLLQPATAGVGIVLAAATTGRPLLTASVFLGLVIVTLAGSLLGSRGILLGLTAVVSFYGADMVRLPWADVPAALFIAAIAALMCVLMLRVLIPDRHVKDAQGLRRTLNIQAKTVDQAVHAAMRKKSNTGSVQRALIALDSTVAKARAHIQAHPESWPRHLARHSGSDLALFAISLEAAINDALSGRGFENLDRAIRDGREAINIGGDDKAENEGHGIGVANVEVAFENRSAPGASAGSQEVRHDPVDAADGAGAARGGRSQISMAIQLFVAAVLATTASMLIDPAHWFWGVLAALVMLFGTSSAADALGKGIRRVLGTAAALPVGLLLVTLTQDSPGLMIAFLLVMMFLQQYVADIAYGWSVFFLTIMLSVIFGFGSSAEDLLAQRLILTSIGALIGIGVALLVVPTRSSTLVVTRALDVLDASDSAITRILAGQPKQEVIDAVNEAQNRYMALKADALASRKGWPVSRKHQLIARHLSNAGVLLLDLRAVANEYRQDHLDQGTVVAAEQARNAVGSLQALLGAATGTSGTALMPPHQTDAASGFDPQTSTLQVSLESLTRTIDGLRHAIIYGA